MNRLFENLDDDPGSRVPTPAPQGDPPAAAAAAAAASPSPLDLSKIPDGEIAAELARRGYGLPPGAAQSAPAKDDDDDGRVPNVLEAIQENAVRQATDHVFGVMSEHAELIERAVADTKEKLRLLPEGGEAEFRRVLGKIKPDELKKYVQSGNHHHAATYLVGQAANEGKLRLPKPRSGPAPVGGSVRDDYESSAEVDAFTRAFGSPPKSKRALAILQSGGSR